LTLVTARPEMQLRFPTHCIPPLQLHAPNRRATRDTQRFTGVHVNRSAVRRRPPRILSTTRVDY
jgi:hypothetical protein